MTERSHQRSAQSICKPVRILKRNRMPDRHDPYRLTSRTSCPDAVDIINVDIADPFGLPILLLELLEEVLDFVISCRFFPDQSGHLPVGFGHSHPISSVKR